MATAIRSWHQECLVIGILQLEEESDAGACSEWRFPRFHWIVNTTPTA